MSLNGTGERPVVDCSKGKRMTVQSDKNQANINSIVRRIEKGGMLHNLNSGTPFYGDVSEYAGLQDAIIKVQNANEMFMDMSPEIRKRFNNNPVELVDFLRDEKNTQEAIDLGMVIKPVEASTVVEPSPPPNTEQ